MIRSLPTLAMALILTLALAPTLTPARAQEEVAPAPTPDQAQVPVEPQPTDAPAAEPMTVTITGVQGLVQVRDAEDLPWRTAEAGMVVPIGADLRTGPRSAVQFRLGEDHTVTLDRLGVMRVIEAIERDGKVVTDVGMLYGRAQYRVEKTAAEHESTVRSPGSTLVVRGSDVIVHNQGFQRRINFLERTPAALKQGNQDVSVSDGELADGADSAAESSSTQGQFSVLGPATTSGELIVQSNLGASTLVAQGVGANVSSSFSASGGVSGSGGVGIGGGTTEPVVGGGGVPIPPGGEFAIVPPAGTFSIVFGWLGSTDIDTLVVTPNGFGVSPFPGSFSGGAPNGVSGSSPDGGIASGDDTGTEGQVNQEHTVFANSPPAGTYRAEATLFSGPAIEVQIRAFLNSTELPGAVRGLVQGGAPNLVTTFTVPGGSISNN